MSALSSVRIPEVEGLQIRVAANEVALAGTIAIKDPRDSLGAFFQDVHQAAVSDKLSKLHVDVTQLSFVNSSSIRVFVDLATRVKTDGGPYLINFRSRRSVAWQRTAFMALQSLAKGSLSVEYTM